METCIDKRNGKYNQNQDPPSVSLLKVLLSKIYAEKRNIVGSNDPIEHVFYDYFYELCASILADVMTMKNQLYLDILDLHNLAKVMTDNIILNLPFDEMEAGSSMHLIGAMQVLKVLLGNIECIGDSSVQQKIKGIYQSAKLGKMLAEAFIVGDNVGKDAENSKIESPWRSIALQLIEEIIFLAEIDDKHIC